LTVWEVVQHLIRTLDREGEQAAARLLANVGGLAEPARELAYRLFTTCEKQGWTDEALAYNGLVVAWPELVRLSASYAQGSLL
jgi:putative DNA methylase